MHKFEKLLRHIADVVDVDLSLELWSGEVIPLCRHPTSELTLRIADPGVIASLMRSPRLLTFISLLASGRLKLVNGTLFEFEPRRHAIVAKLRAGAWRKIDKRLMLSALTPFLLKSGRAAREDAAYRGARDDKAQVQFHYDLSNDFYALFLDPLMVYSCAYFPRFDASLEDAQRAKLDIVCRKLRLKPGEKFLDIGCGWGGLVIHAAQHYGVIAHGATLSQKQYDYVQARIAALGLEDRVKIELADFRDFEGPFDKIASIGMFEHVGEKNLEAYFAKVFSLLKVRGLYLHHAITRRSRRDNRYRRMPITRAAIRYIFPGGWLDPIANTIASLEKHEFDVHDVENLREHYALTCRAWTHRLYARRAEASEMVGEARTDLWLLYLAAGALGFERGAAAIFQTLASKRAPGPSGLPATRADIYA